MNKITVKVPATSANLACGFDSFGCAYSLYNTLEFTVGDDPLSVEGCAEKYRNENNMAVVAFNKVLEKAHSSLKLSKLIINADIPVSRGLGSSSAMLVGGAFAANELLGKPFSDEDIVQIAASLEGHPDNVAPAYYGGLTASAMKGSEVITARFNIHPSIKFILIIPNFELSTEKARAVLPKEVKFSDAVFNLSRTALLIQGLSTGDERMIRFGMDDVLHTPYRKSLISGFDKVKALALSSGALAFCISGAGPTMLAVANSESVFEKLKASIDSDSSLDMRVIQLEPNFKGCEVC